jgi:hypothetical protein
MTDIPEKDGELGLKLVSIMNELTWERHGTMGVDNAQRNSRLLDRGQSLAALRDAPLGDGDSAIVIAAGPSIKRQDPIAAIRRANYRGAIVVTESALMYCLRNGIVPDLAVTLDPHATRIVRWFGDPKLTEQAIRADDYYSRQDMDEAFADEMRANAEAMRLIDTHGKKIRIALATSASEAVVERVLEAGMEIYWWNPMYDDPDDPDSVTAGLQRMNRLPTVNSGGNVGSAAWMMASAVLGKKHVALTGMDFSYYDGTPYRNTQYYNEMVDLVGEENLGALYMRIYNPHTESWFFTDPAYRWYRETFLEMAADADCETCNCTGGGILFGESVEFAGLDEFIERHS